MPESKHPAPCAMGFVVNLKTRMRTKTRCSRLRYDSLLLAVDELLGWHERMGNDSTAIRCTWYSYPDKAVALAEKARREIEGDNDV